MGLVCRGFRVQGVGSGCWCVSGGLWVLLVVLVVAYALSFWVALGSGFLWVGVTQAGGFGRLGG